MQIIYKKGVIMCNNADSIRKLVDLDSNNDHTGLLTITLKWKV